MKTIGLIGGMSWESTLVYYKLINEGIKDRLGGLHSAKIILHSVDFAPIAKMQEEGRWDEASIELTRIALSLEKAGADFIVVCTNTMHKIVPFITPYITIPVIHIAKATAQHLNALDIKNVLLLGTKFTMKEPFYREILHAHGIEVHIPEADEIEKINAIIFNELCVGKIETSSNEYMNSLIKHYQKIHPSLDGIILGCTELGLLLKDEEIDIPLFDTTVVHANCAIQKAIED